MKGYYTFWVMMKNQWFSTIWWFCVRVKSGRSLYDMSAIHTPRPPLRRARVRHFSWNPSIYMHNLYSNCCFFYELIMNSIFRWIYVSLCVSVCWKYLSSHCTWKKIWENMLADPWNVTLKDSVLACQFCDLIPHFLSARPSCNPNVDRPSDAGRELQYVDSKWKWDYNLILHCKQTTASKANTPQYKHTGYLCKTHDTVPSITGR